MKKLTNPTIAMPILWGAVIVGNYFAIIKFL